MSHLGLILNILCFCNKIDFQPIIPLETYTDAEIFSQQTLVFMTS